MRAIGFIACCVLSACSFEAKSDSAAIESNTCTTDEDCEDGMCENGMCTASRAVDELEVVLEVTPIQARGGGPTIPIMLEPFPVVGPMNSAWSLPAPAVVRGRIRQGARIVEGDVSFVSTRSLPGLAPKMVSTVVSVLGVTDSSFDYEVTLPSGGEYTLIVQPSEATLPPLRRTIEVSGDTQQDFNYDDLELVARKYEIAGGPADRELLVRAVGSAGELISSASHVVDDSVTLLFEDPDVDYRLIVRAEDTYDEADEGASDNCDHETPVLPTFSIASADIVLDDDKVAHLTLPAAPSRVRYEGAIELCDAPGVLASAPATLPIVLRSSAVALEQADASLGPWSAELAIDTDATRIGDTGRYEYCLDVMPGDYAVVLTPPTGMPCELFAEQRPIEATERGRPPAAILELSNAATLTGTLETFDRMAIPSAVIDLQSRGRADTIMLDETDASLTNYGRSRQVTTDANGAFSLPVDLGSYDVTIRPPPGSGFAWFVKRDVAIGRRGQTFGTTITMGSPIVVECSIGYEGAALSLLAGAEVTAYALIDDEGTDGKRALAIGDAVVDESGHFSLLLPSEIVAGW